MAGPKIGHFFYLSFGAHLVALGTLALVSFRNPRPGFNFNVMQVQLYSPGQISAGSGKTGDTGAKESKPAAADAPASAQKARPNLPKDPFKEDISKGSGPAKNRVSDAERKAVQNAISEIANEVGASERAGVDAEWNSLVSGINVDLERRSYNIRAAEVYKRNWVVPASVPPDKSLRVRAVVRIDKFGNVIDYQIFSPSKNKDLDRSVNKLLDLVKTLPAPPWMEGSNWYTFAMEFRPYLEE